MSAQATRLEGCISERETQATDTSEMTKIGVTCYETQSVIHATLRNKSVC